jgi:tetratricopeptide (TPR) repeat protein
MKNKRIIYFPYFVLGCLLVLISACSTTKNTFIHRGWHNMNARYNGYFYSREYMKESIVKVEKANKDDFTKVIPLFIYPDNQTAKNFNSDFDKSIKKSSTVIQRHCITDKKKKEIPNACRWIDENYMLIGKSHLYKRDFFSALEVFEYVAKIYPKPETKYQGMLWVIRTNNEIGSLSQSEPVMDEIRNAKDVPKDKYFQRDLAAVSADYFIKRSDYSPAIKQLTKAIALTRKKTTRARFTYVLAQLYEKMGDNKKASMYYAMVPGLHPVYDMEFSAKINQAKLYDISSGDSKVIKKQLLKMIKDDKNIEFRDQIYYALAQIAEKEKDMPLAVDYLNKSIQKSVSNNTQKALSYLKRADIFFDKQDYKVAQANYDSAITVLPKDYPDYALIEAKKKSLTSLVLNLNIIALQDSVNRLAAMSEKDRGRVIDKMIAKIEAEEKKAEEEKQTELYNQQQVAQNQTTVAATTQSGSWYFYNPATVSFGVNEFTKKWGSRKLEDNWRRSEKDQVMAANVNEETTEPVDSTEKKDNPIAGTGANKNKKDRNYYLKKIPLTPEALTKSNEKIVDAYYNVGSIYKEQLLNNQKSVEAFEELLKKYPDNKYKLNSYYQLYRTYLAMNNKPKSDYYKNILLTDYPDTEYAKIIKNPDYAKDVMASKSLVEKFYTETYQLYSDGKYAEALANCRKADTMYSKNYLMPQFTFIKALCIGRTQDINAFENALTQIIIKYPKEPVKDKAQEILDMIKKQKMQPTMDTAHTAVVDSAKTKTKFIFKEDGDYYWVVIVENGKGDLNKFKTKLSNFNTVTFSTEELEISSIFLDLNHQLISVKTFDGKGKAMDYYNFLKTKNDIFSDLDAGTYQSFIISAENYPAFYKDKNIAEYQTFFTQNFK